MSALHSSFCCNSFFFFFFILENFWIILCAFFLHYVMCTKWYSGTRFYLFRSTHYQTMRNLFYYDDQYQTQAQLTALTASEVLLNVLRRVSCRQTIPLRQIWILCVILYINFWMLLTSDFRSLPSHPHRWWMGCRISLLRYASWGLKPWTVCSTKKNKALETFETVESQRPSRVSVTAWSGKVMNPPPNAGSRPPCPNLIFWISLFTLALLHLPAFMAASPVLTWEV